MNKKRICVTIPRELYDKYKDEYVFSGLLTMLLYHIDFGDSKDFVVHIGGKVIAIHAKDADTFLKYIKEINKK